MRKETLWSLILAGACLLGAFGHHLLFIRQVNEAIVNAERVIQSVGGNSTKEVPGAETLRYSLATTTTLLKISLLSTGILVGIAFGFLGFALFIMGITGASTIDAATQGNQLRIENAAPGLIIIVSASILVGVCVTRPISVEYVSPTNKAEVKSSPTDGVGSNLSNSRGAP